jgi:YD repeat-containing protein
LAQTIGESISAYVGPPAEKLAITPGGVDIRTGRYAYSQTDLGIREGEGGGLTLARSMGSPSVRSFGNFAHNWDIALIIKRVDIDAGNYANGSGEDYRVIVYLNGRSETFESQSYETGFQQVSKSSLAKLTYTGVRDSANVVYTYEASDGTIARFRPGSALVDEVILPNGTRLLFDYEAPPAGTPSYERLRSVTSTRGYALLFEYGGSGGGWNHVAKACVINLAQTAKPASNVCPASAPTSTYSYTQFRGTRLATVTDPTGATSQFSYADLGGQLLMGFIKPGQTTAWMSNLIGEGSTLQGDPVEATYSQSFATGESYSYEYDTGFDQTGGTVDTIAGGAITNALGETTQVRYAFPRRPESMNPERLDPWGTKQENIGDAFYQVTSGPVSITDPLDRTTNYDYCDPYMAQALPATDQHRCVVTELQSYTDPDGIKTELSYSSGGLVTGVRRKARTGSGLSDIVISATYQCSNLKTCVTPNKVIDANGNESRATYSPDHGGVLTETGPAVNGVQPQKRYAYSQRYAWISNGSGGYVQAANPVWLLTSTSFCRTSAATGNPASPCATAGDEVLTTYDYGPNSGPNNLLLRGTVVTADGQSLRTCQSYDANGRRISETGAGANLTSCQ